MRCAISCDFAIVSSRHGGWEFAHVAVDNHSRAGFVEMHADERKDSATAFLKTTLERLAVSGITVKLLLTDRSGLPLRALRRNLPSARHQAHLHPTPHPANQ